MRVGIQTISWGARPSLDAMLSQISGAGYEGVEIAQHPELLGRASELSMKLRDLNLSLVGLSGGSFTERASFLRVYAHFQRVRLVETYAVRDRMPENYVPPYAYLDDWGGREQKEVELALTLGERVAIHPHMFRSVQTGLEAERVLGAQPLLLFLPDVAHLTVAGDDVLATIERGLTRLAAVHLKDWRAEFGRSYQFYSRGFCELGQGAAPILEVLNLLRSRSYGGWVVVEQDVSPNPVASARRSRDWLRHTLSL